MTFHLSKLSLICASKYSSPSESLKKATVLEEWFLLSLWSGEVNFSEFFLKISCRKQEGGRFFRASRNWPLTTHTYTRRILCSFNRKYYTEKRAYSGEVLSDNILLTGWGDRWCWTLQTTLCYWILLTVTAGVSHTSATTKALTLWSLLTSAGLRLRKRSLRSYISLRKVYHFPKNRQRTISYDKNSDSLSVAT